jgi:signal transduction histidine kinase
MLDRIVPRSLRWKFMLAPIVGALLIALLALFLVRSTEEELEKLRSLHAEEATVGEFLNRIGDELATTHGLIYQLLLSVDAQTDEGVLHDQSKRLIYKLHRLEDRIEKELLSGLLQSTERVQVERILNLLDSYRVNATNAFLMSTVDTRQARRVMNDAATNFNGLNSVLFNVSNIIGKRLDERLKQHEDVMKERTDLFAMFCFAAAIGMLLTGFVLSNFLSRDLRTIAGQLQGLLDRSSGDEHPRDMRRLMIVDTLNRAVEQVQENYSKLEETQRELEDTNERLTRSLKLVAERETALAEVNDEMKRTVARQGQLIRAQMEAEIARDAALSSAERANAAKSDFLAHMSHELRTPLNAIIGFSDMIHAAVFGPIDTKYKEYAQDIGVSGRHLLDLVTDILDVTRIEAGEIEINREHVDLAELVETCAMMTRLQAEDAGVVLEFDVPRNLPQVIVDPTRFRQVLVNLMDNAIKYTPEGGRVRVFGQAMANGDVAIAVADTGVGIAEADIPRALEKFGQIRSGHMEAHGGAGVGLSIVKLLVELLEGELELKSEVGKGSTMTVILPKRLTHLPPDRGVSSC